MVAVHIAKIIQPAKIYQVEGLYHLEIGDGILMDQDQQITNKMDIDLCPC
jgi:hypothetical protein